MAEAKPVASLSSGLLARKGAARPAMRRPAAMGFAEGAVAQDDLGWNDMGYDVSPDADGGAKPHVNPLAGAIMDATPEVKRQQDLIADRLAQQAADELQPIAWGEQAEPQDDTVHYMNQGVNDEEAEQESDVADENYHPQPAPSLTIAPRPMSAKVQALPIVHEEVEPEAPQDAPEPMFAHPLARQAAPKAPKARGAVNQMGKAAFTLRLDAGRHLRLRLACAVGNLSAQKLVTNALDKYLAGMPEIESLVAQVSEDSARHG